MNGMGLPPLSQIPGSVPGLSEFVCARVYSCWCVNRKGEPVLNGSASRFYYKKAGIRLRCADIAPARGQRPPSIPASTNPPITEVRPAVEGRPGDEDEGPVVISRDEAAAANIPIHFQIVD